MTKLVLDITDIKTQVAIDFIAGFDVLEPFIQDNEFWLMRKYLGNTLLNKLAQVRIPPAENPNTDGLYDELLALAQGIIINRSIMQYIPEGQLDISENGIRINTTDTKKTAFEWQINKLEKRYLDTANEKIEILLEILFSNDIPQWQDSAISKKVRSNFINSAIQFDKYFSINESHLTFLYFLSHIEYFERVYLRSALGEEFFLELKEKIAASEDGYKENATETDKKYFVLFGLIRAVLVYMSVSITGSEIKKPDDMDTRAAFAQQQLKEYLDNNSSTDVFTLYFTSSKYTDPLSITATSTGIDNSTLSGCFGAF
jgi:hypothetical protein